MEGDAAPVISNCHRDYPRPPGLRFVGGFGVSDVLEWFEVQALGMPDKTASTDQPDIAKRIAELIVNDWVTKAAKVQIKRKAEAISDVACTLADLLNRDVSQDEMIAAALREAINQCQTAQGFVFVPDLMCVIRYLEGKKS